MLREKTIFIKITKIIFTKSTKISKRKLSRMVIFALLCSSINFVNNTYAKERSIDESDLSAKAAVLIDGENGRILFGKNEKEKRAMASTTKIMTCIVALENCKANQVVEISSKAASMPKVKMNVMKGEQYYLKDLLYAMMLESYNDVAVAVAESIGGNVENFAKMMNEKAKKIGANNTSFVTPNGLDAKEHYSTAYDMAKIGAYAIKNNSFLEIINTKKYNLTEIKNKRNITVFNKDNFLNLENDAIGIKTGFTCNAGYCFVGAIKNNGRTYVSCVLASGWPPNKGYKWKDTIKLMDYGKDNYEFKNIIEKNKPIMLPVENGIKSEIKCTLDSSLKALVSNEDKINIKTKIDYKLPINVKDKVGSVWVYINNKIVKKIKIISKEKVYKFNFTYCLRKALSYFIL